MANENQYRVLSRQGARLVTHEEASAVAGGFTPVTNSACTFDIRVFAAGGNGADGDGIFDHCP